MDDKKMKKFLAILIFCSVSLASKAEPLPCLLQPDESVELGSPVSGVISEIFVERGDRVTAGQLIATLEAGVELRGVQLANERLRDDAELQSSKAALEHAKREKSRAQKMFESKLVSRQYLDKAITEASIAEHRYQQARSRLQQSRLELKVADARLSQKQITSPVDGLVTERFVSSGQRVQDNPVARIVKTSPLRVEVIVPAERYGEFSEGQAFLVKPELPGLEPRTARVSIIDRIIDSASNSFRLTLVMDNQDSRMPAGIRCSIDLNQVEESL